MKKKFLTILICLLLFPASAFCYNLSGKELLNYCQAALDVFDKNTGRVQTEAEYLQGVKAGICEGYLMAIASTNNFNSVCLPESCRTAKTIVAVAKFLKDNPQTLQSDAAPLVASAYKKYFPCR